jgi:iron(III) transport system substrate-binding protein
VIKAFSVAALLLAIVLAGCSSDAGSDSKTLTLYTCANDAVEQAVVKAYEHGHPSSKIDVFRAPTGQLNARVAADVRGGGIKADVIWACDPLTMHGYDTQGLIRAWTPPAAPTPAYRTANSIGVDVLYLVAVVHKGVTPPASWADLAQPTYRGGVAVPSPSFAAAALGALGYFAAAPGYGISYYEKLKANGAKQVNSPDNVLTGVAQGTYRAGFTLANAAYAAQQKGSPIEVVWPTPGAIAIPAPIGVTSKKHPSPQAIEFAAFTASPAGQTAIAHAGAYVPTPGVPGPPLPAGSPIVSPDWPAMFGDSATLLGRYAKVFGT